MVAGKPGSADRIRVTAATSRGDLRDFMEYPLRLYRGDPCFVPHLLWERKQFFSAKNPIFAFTDVTYFLARDGRGKVVGRATAHVNHRHNEFWGERTGFFGFFECVERIGAARALTQAVEERLRESGMTLVRGPLNFSTNEECGFLAEGFDRPPAFMMPYTKPYYLAFMEELGYERAKDLLAYSCQYEGHIPEHLVRFSGRARERSGVTVRTMDLRRFEEEVEAVFRIYNSAWERNWGFVPMTEEQFRHMAKNLKPIVDPAIALIAEKDGEPVAFSLGLPDYNVLLRKTNGRLFPFGFVHLLFAKRRIHRARILTLGVLPEYRNQGIDVLLYHDTFRNGTAHGYWSCEMSWMLEDNVLMNRALKRMGAVLYKRYRIFEKKL